MKYLVEFNNGYENDENTLTCGFDTLEEAKKYAKENNDVYYLILSGQFEQDEDGIWCGSGEGILTNCDDSSITWFYNWNADFCKVEEL